MTNGAGPSPDAFDAVGVYGAAVATILGAIKAWEFRRDRAAIRFDLSEVSFGSPGDPSDLGPPELRIEITNVGRRDVTIQEVGLLVSGGRQLRFGDSDLAVTLKESEPLVLTEETDVGKGRLIDLGRGTRLIGMYAKAYGGKRHRARRR